MISEVTLLSDQVFQLNMFLWALNHLPEEIRIRPVLRRAGYYLGAIGRGVIVPVEDSVVEALDRLTGSPDRSPCRPDLWLKHSDDQVEPIVELKSHGFSPHSENKKQALKLLASAFDLAPSLGQSAVHPGHVVYATTSTDAPELAATLNTLAASLRAANTLAAPTAVIGLSIEKDGVALSSPTPSDLPTPAADALATPAVVLRRKGDDDLFSLYLIPWIPGIDDSQDPGLNADGMHQMTARILTFAQAVIGRAIVPTTLALDGTQMLRHATLGVFAHWQDKDRKKFSEAAARIVETALRPHVQIRREGGDRLEIDLPDTEVQATAVGRLESADPADPAKNLESAAGDQSTIFDFI